MQQDDLDALALSICQRIQSFAKHIDANDDPDDLALLRAVRDEADAAIRHCAIASHLRGNYSDARIAKPLGITRQAFNQWITKHREEGR